MSSARDAALEALVLFDRAPRPVRDILEELFEKRTPLSGPDRAFARDLAAGTLGRQNTIDWVIGRFSRRPLSLMDAFTRAALRLGVYQLRYAGERVPAYAAVNETVGLLKKRRKVAATAFVNGILRTVERNPMEPSWPGAGKDPLRLFSLRHSHPEWLVRRWLDRLGPKECEALLIKNNETPPFCLRVNQAKQGAEELVDVLRGEGVGADLSPVLPGALRLAASASLGTLASFREGRFSVQDESSQLAVVLLDPKPGETIFDVCAGVGGKSTHMVERMQNKGAVLAVDTNSQRLSVLKENAWRLGARIIKTLVADARQMPQGFMADRVFVDVPCSGLGTLRRRPDLKWTKSEDDVTRRLPLLQREILAGAAKAVKPGGVLVYATCSTETEESEAVVNAFLETQNTFCVQDPCAFLPAALLSAVTPDHFVRLWPHRQGTDGFFMFRMVKNA